MDLVETWKAEENIAQICGWDFSHLDGRCTEEPLPWDYRQVIMAYLTPDMMLLDIDTGGGEFLLSLNHPHANTAATEIYRVLKPGGLFITQQVGAENDRELVDLLCGKTEIPFPEQYADKIAARFRSAGFLVLRQEESYRPMRFYDVGALVWFAHVIPWEFPHFSEDTHLQKLLKAQILLEKNGSIDGTTQRILLIAQKK